MEPSKCRHLVAKFASIFKWLTITQVTKSISGFVVRLAMFLSQLVWNQMHLFLDWIQNWAQDGATCNHPKFGYQLVLHALVLNLSTSLVAPFLLPLCLRFPYYQKFSHQMAPLALVPILATRRRYLHCPIAFDCPIGSISKY